MDMIFVVDLSLSKIARGVKEIIKMFITLCALITFIIINHCHENVY